MFIVVEHEITNKDAFFGSGEDVISNAPQGVKPIQFFPSTDRKRAVCLWEAGSIDAVEKYLEPKITKSSKNKYYAVDSTVAMGLPIPA